MSDSPERASTGAAVETRAGYVALVGLPNVGKSTLLNALTGEKLSIVTPRAQTTRERVMGILTTDRAQLVFVDTPGLLEPRYLLQESMLHAARGAIMDADAVLLLLDALRPGETLPAGEPLRLLERRREALFVVVNKIDVVAAETVDELGERARAQFGVEPHQVSAVTGVGVAELREALAATLPISPYLYPADELAVQPVRFFVAELIRETVFERYEQEVPYSTAVQIEEFRETEDPVYIRATIVLERDTQKAIVIGSGGVGIRDLGQRSRSKIEAFIGRHIYLDLWVKTRPGWRKKAAALREFGYPPPERA
ncbi:MAG: GTPase Era [Longimicrobiales bacterium]